MKFLPELLKIMSISLEFIQTSQGFSPTQCTSSWQPLDERDVDDPKMIFVHPQSQFYLDVRDNSRSLSLPPFPDNIQFPTRTAFLDSMIAMLLDPSSGQGLALF